MSTGGEGGMVITDDETLFKRMWSYKDHGKDFDAVFHQDHPPGYRWLHASFGTNWRMTAMQAAIGRVQLKKLPRWLDIRARNAGILSSCLSDVDGVHVPDVPSNVQHAYYKFTCYLENRDAVMQELNKQGIPATIGSCSEIYRERAFGWTKRLPNAKQLQATSLCLQVHPSLEEEHMHAVGETVAAAIRRCR